MGERSNTKGDEMNDYNRLTDDEIQILNKGFTESTK
jgi:hypothetical protein